MKTSIDIRSAYLEYFRERGHEVVPSSGVIPQNDPTLLFTNAGMVQFKDVFLGEDKRAYKRAASSQKCIRISGKHNDLENVGRTARHQTFFEMLGNFSFGDYFKREAIAFAWELLTKVYKIPAERLCVTVFGGEDGLPADDEARAIWRDVTGFGDERIIGLGKADNFWSMGDTGPCGPCTEIHYYAGETPDIRTFGIEPGGDGVGWTEIWNNVFMQFNRAVKNGALTPLPAPCVDTGMGLERITRVLQGVRSNYDTDLLRPYVQKAADIAGRTYTATDRESDVSMRVIADHARMAAFSLAEGIMPGNKGRAAALRSVMRRAIRHGYKQEIREPFFHLVVDEVITHMGPVYPELVQHRDFILDQSRAEDERFRALVPSGLGQIEKFSGWRTDDFGRKVMPGEFAHELHSTFGFPIDLTEVIGEEQGFTVDVAGFEKARDAHAKGSGADDDSGADGVHVTQDERVRVEHREARAAVGPEGVRFTGYDHEEGTSRVVVLLEGAYTDRVRLSRVESLAEGVFGQVVVAETPFYGESGGQVGDLGTIRTAGGVFEVIDTQKPVAGLVVHIGRVTSGSIRVGDEATLTIDHAQRDATRRNHSATHLLHWALRKVLGTHAQQKGSKVGPNTLRFDYASTRALSHEEQSKIEDLVNAEVLANLDVRTNVTTQAEARAQGAMMIFEEKYGSSVRMLHIGHESVELCGGTHARRTGDIGLFKIVSDSNLGSGVRRIEAVTGLNTLAAMRGLEGSLARVAEALKSSVDDVPARVEKALDHQRELQRQIEDLKRKLLAGDSGSVEVVALEGGVKLVVQRAPVAEQEALRQYADKLRDSHGPAVVVLGAVSAENKAILLCAVSKAVTDRFHAGKIVGALAAIVGGRGGGKPDLAQAGGPDASKIDEALAQARTTVR